MRLSVKHIRQNRFQVSQVRLGAETSGLNSHFNEKTRQHTVDDVYDLLESFVANLAVVKYLAPEFKVRATTTTYRQVIGWFAMATCRQ